MKKNSSFVISLLILITMAGCQKTPESDIVIGKGDAALEKAIDQGSTQADVKYEAPKQWTDSIEKDNLIINVDADVIVPDTIQFPSAVMTADEISQQTADNIMRVLLDGATLYELRPNYPYTKEEINEELLLIKKSISDPNADFNTVLEKGTPEHDAILEDKQKQIAELEKAYESAPETIDIKPADTNFQRVNSPESIPVFIEEGITEEERLVLEEENKAAMEASKNATYYEIKGDATLANGIKADLRITKTNVSFLLETFGNIEDSENQKQYDIAVTEGGISQEQARENALQVINEIGIDYLEISEVEESYYIERDETGMPVSKRPCYTFYFTHSIGGVTENYALAKDTPLKEDQYRQLELNEVATIVIGKEGVILFQWWTPLQISEMKNESTSMLKFEDIQEVFRKQIILDNIDTSVSVVASSYDLSVLENHIVIEKAKLGLMRVLRQGKLGEYLMIPVWDFYGYETVKFENPQAAREMQFDVDDNGECVVKKMYQSYLTINAIDGSIIDRQKGY